MHNEQNYLQHILALSDSRHVTTSRPVVARNGIKLLDQWAHLSSALYDKLVLHKLSTPLDECLAVENLLSGETLKADFQQLVLSQSSFRQALQSNDALRLLLSNVADLQLSPLAAFKLTLMRQQLYDSYRHSLEVAFCAFVLSVSHQDLSRQSQQHVLAAGLFHDFGLLHVDPATLAHRGSFSELDWQQIYAHPVTGYLIAQRMAEWPPEVAQAILEHHERLDGSGYPRGARASEISLLGQLLALAELAASIFSRPLGATVSEQIHVLLRLNQGKFNKELAQVLLNIAMTIQSSQTPTSRNESYSDILESLVNLSMHFQDWRAIIVNSGALPVVSLVNQRLEHLQHNLASLGVDLDYWGMIDKELKDDKATLDELAICVFEGKWQLKAIAQEVTRKWDKLCPQHHQIQKNIWEWKQRIDAM